MTIDEYDPLTLPADGFSMIFIGARRQGKTFLLTEMLYKLSEHRKWDVVFLFSETAVVQDAYHFVPDQFKYDHLDEKVIKRILQKQEQMKDHNNRSDEPDQVKMPRVLIIADDVINDRKVRTGVVNRLFTQGRHYGIDCVFLSQSIVGMHPKSRANSDLIVFFRSIARREREFFVESYLTVRDSRQARTEGNDLMLEVFSTPYCAVIVDVAKSINARELNDYVFKYCATSGGTPEFQLGHPKFWDEIE